MKKVLIANRGEIALRIIRACHRLGLQAVAVFSEADRYSAHVLAADDAVCLGPGPARESYLSADRLFLAAKSKGVDAIHPGYGFLAESSEFARTSERAGYIFVGPSAEVIHLMGDKVRARERAVKAGVSVVPGSSRGFTTEHVSQAREVAVNVGFPLLLKASAGGGGKGMRIVRDEEAFDAEFKQASREAEAAFGDGTVYMERYFDRARHIEVQVLGDEHGHHVHLGERDCTVQRRYQKLIEECPSPAITEQQRKEVCEMASALAKDVSYRSAGTVEFLFDPSGGRFYFMEMNTRIQVEHRVTEMVTGVDLVAEQLRVAAGEPLSEECLSPEKRSSHFGHAIEWRINAEDPSRDFMPTPGQVTAWSCAHEPGVQLDSHVYPGYVVPPYYDSLLGKLIVAGESREQVLVRARTVLESFTVQGVQTSIPFFLRLFDEPDFIGSNIYTRWVDDHIGRIYGKKN